MCHERRVVDLRWLGLTLCIFFSLLLVADFLGKMFTPVLSWIRWSVVANHRPSVSQKPRGECTTEAAGIQKVVLPDAKGTQAMSAIGMVSPMTFMDDQCKNFARWPASLTAPRTGMIVWPQDCLGFRVAQGIKKLR